MNLQLKINYMKKELLEIDLIFKANRNLDVEKNIKFLGIFLIYILKNLNFFFSFLKKKNFKIWFCACKIRDRNSSVDSMEFFFQKNLERMYNLVNCRFLYNKPSFFTKNERLFDVISIFLKLLKFRVRWKSEIFFSGNLPNGFFLQNFKTNGKKIYSKIKIKLIERCDFTGLFLAKQNITDTLVSKIWFFDKEKKITHLPWWRKLNTRESELEFYELSRVYTESINLDKFKN